MDPHVNGFRRFLVQAIRDIKIVADKAIDASNQVIAQRPRDLEQAVFYRTQFEAIQQHCILVLSAAGIPHSPVSDSTLEYCWRILRPAWSAAIHGDTLKAEQLDNLRREVLILLHFHQGA